MKKTIAIAAMLVVGMAQAAEKKSPVEKCQTLAKLAEVTMKARQHGVQMDELYTKMPNNKLIRHILRRAYERPRYLTAEMQQYEIVQFRNYWFSVCLEALERRK